MGLIIVESTVVAYAAQPRLAAWKRGQLQRLMEVIVREHDELLEADGAVYSATALHALTYARAAGAQVAVYTPQHEAGARRFFMYQGIPLVQETWTHLVERNPGAAYLTTVLLKRSAPLDVHPRFSPTRLTHLGLTPLHVAQALDLLNIRRPA
ncbi:hypothetical protein [Microbacterium sp. MRS-1]|uniref:hypothetical protein n=1 Tax=Microbacterium sp. MRS-1 TaxID=1451261 RepID=UPI00044B9348|nr:hypothetical protein [Microbacterium sp. MRS-1]EXJ50542.1 hypothetical protein AS96_14125 [Microbacterium sp. MRS-1]